MSALEAGLTTGENRGEERVEILGLEYRSHEVDERKAVNRSSTFLATIHILTAPSFNTTRSNVNATILLSF